MFFHRFEEAKSSSTQPSSDTTRARCVPGLFSHQFTESGDTWRDPPSRQRPLETECLIPAFTAAAASGPLAAPGPATLSYFRDSCARIPGSATITRGRRVDLTFSLYAHAVRVAATYGRD